MAAITIFDRLAWFDISEQWGNPKKMDGFLLLMADEIRDMIKSRFVVLCAYELSGHSPTGQHPKGKAIDFYFPDLDFKTAYYRLKKILNVLQLSNFCGLGLYFDWTHKGFHLDSRGYRSRWCRIDGDYKNIHAGLKLLEKGEY